MFVAALVLLALGLAPPVGAFAAGVQSVTVQAEVPVTPVDLRVGHANNSPMLAAHPHDSRFLALANRVDGPDFSCSLHVSGDTGRTWVPANPVPQLPAGADKCYGPEVAFDASGALHFLFVGLTGRANTPMGAFLTTSRDGGRTFTPPRQVLGPNSFQVRMAIATSGDTKGRMHLVWLKTSTDPGIGAMPPFPNPIMAAYSDDDGATFSQPVQVSDPARRRVMAPALALGPGRSVHVLYYDLEDDAVDYQGLEGPVWPGTWTLVLATSRDGGEGFGESAVVDRDIVPPERVMLIFTMPPPAVAVDRRGRLFAAWHDGRNGDWDVFLRHSSDGGTSWAPPQRLNDDAVRNGRHQYLPRLAVAPDGRVDAIFYDRRGDPENIANRVSYTFSEKAGATFSPNVTLTRQSSNSLVGQRYPIASAQGQVEFGSRLALTATGSSLVAAWTDTRNVLGKADAAAGPITQDVLATQVDLPAGDRTAVVMVLGLTAAGVATAAVVLVAARRRRVPGRTRRPSPASLFAGGLALVAASCGGDGPQLPARAEILDVTMRDHEFDYDGAPASGRVVLRARNAGQAEHELTLTLLPDDLPLSVDAQLRSPTRRAFPTLAYLPARPSGVDGSFAVDMAPGRYAFVCFVKDASGQSHALQGMTGEFRVR